MNRTVQTNCFQNPSKKARIQNAMGVQLQLPLMDREAL